MERNTHLIFDLYNDIEIVELLGIKIILEVFCQHLIHHFSQIFIAYFSLQIRIRTLPIILVSINTPVSSLRCL